MYRQRMFFEKDRQRLDVVAVLMRQENCRKAVRVNPADLQRRTERPRVFSRINEEPGLPGNDQKRVAGGPGVKGIEVQICHEKMLQSGNRKRITVSMRSVKSTGSRM